MLEEKDKNTITPKHIIWGSIIILAVWIVSGFLTHNLVDDRGTFGDMFGAVNSLFSGFALFGIILSIYIQRQELGAQKEELRLTRGEFKQTRLTNIVFKKIESVNRTINSTEFRAFGANFNNVFGEDARHILDLKLVDFVNHIKHEPEYRDKDSFIEIKNSNDEIFCENMDEFYFLFNTVSRDITGLKRLFDSSGLKGSAIEELELTYADALSNHFAELIFRLSGMIPRIKLGQYKFRRKDVQSLTEILRDINNIHSFLYRENL